MLSWFRKHSRSWVVKALYLFIAITFFGGFGFFMNEYFRPSGPASESRDAVAIVDGEKISARDFYKAFTNARRNWYQQMERVYGEIPEGLLDNEALKQNVLDEMISRTILVQEAKKLGLWVSDEEVKNEIVRMPYFWDNQGRFDARAYQNLLSREGLSKEAFEESVKERLLVNRFIHIIVSSVAVDDEELKSYYQKLKEQVNLSYFLIDADERYKNLKPTEQEIKDYYQAHLKDFDWTETRRVRFLSFHIPSFEKEVRVSQAEIKDYYEQSKERYLVKPEQVRIRHILLKPKDINKKEEFEKTEKEAFKIIDEFRAGADFGELAKKYSMDVETAVNGGEIGWVSKGMVLPEVENKIFALTVGGVSEPIRTQAGVHIFQVEEYKSSEYQPLNQVRDKVKQELVRNKSHILAEEQAGEVLKTWQEKGIEEVVKKYGLKPKESEWFKKGEWDLEGIADSRNITEEAFYLEEGEVSDIISGLDDLYIIEVIGIKEPHQASLEEAMPKILRKLVPELRLGLAREEARKYLNQAKQGTALSQLAWQAKTGLKETGFFKRGDKSIPELGYSEELAKIIFNLSEEAPFPEDVYENGKKVYVIKLKEVKPADMSSYAEEKELVKEELLSKKQQESIDRYVENLKQGRVQIVEEIYKQIN